MKGIHGKKHDNSIKIIQRYTGTSDSLLYERCKDGHHYMFFYNRNEEILFNEKDIK